MNGLTASFVTSAMTGPAPYAVVSDGEADLTIDESGDVTNRLSRSAARCECS